MNREEQGQNKKPLLSPPTIAVLLIGLGLIAYMLLPPLFAPETKTPGGAGDANSKVSSLPVKNSDRPVTPSTREAQSTSVPVARDVVAPAGGMTPAREGALSDRDPFIPAVMPGGTRVKPSEALKTLPEVIATKFQPSEAPLPAVQLAWKGLVGRAGVGQVVIIQHNQKTYILRRGDPVPGTEYVVTEVTPDSVLLVAPDEQKRLFKKKEAKING
jgi:hypothetical protein